jgi:4-amino-4-deoxy-L-arabinose transferase-like glycosyltransferase
MCEACGRSRLLPQILLVFAAWLFVCWLHWSNDGLWYGDAPRHAANGIFWKDYLLSLSLEPQGYALSYLARYPVIAPTSYPPAFYLLEAFLFGLFGPSPYIAKGFVLGFALMGAFYASAWSRRWISEEAGWAGVLFLLLPGVIEWSHAIMLNIPAVAMSVGSLYHFRRWLESPPHSVQWRHLYIGAALAVVSILTYITSGVIVLIAGVWVVAERRWRLLLNYRSLAVLLVSTLALLPWAIVVVKFERSRMIWATGTAEQFVEVPWSYYLECIRYYPKRLPGLFGRNLLLLATIGVGGGLFVRKWRHETTLLLILSVVCFAFFSYIPAKEARYVLLLSLPVVIFSMLGVFSIVLSIDKLAGMSARWSRIVTLTAVAGLLVSQAWLGSRVYVMSISGYRELVSFLEQIAPDEAIFYDGKHYATFTFYVQAGDPDYQRRVVLGRKLLYAESMYSEPEKFASSADEVVEVLQKQGGCRWLAVADQPDAPYLSVPWHLREAVQGPEFELAGAFPVVRELPDGPETINVGVYRFLEPIERVEEVELPLFSLGDGVVRRIKPIEK